MNQPDVSIFQKIGYDSIIFKGKFYNTDKRLWSFWYLDFIWNLENYDEYALLLLGVILQLKLTDEHSKKSDID